MALQDEKKMKDPQICPCQEAITQILSFHVLIQKARFIFLFLRTIPIV